MELIFCIWCEIGVTVDFSFSFLKNFYWHIVDLQCCVNSGVQQSDSVIHVSILFQILFPFRFLQNIWQSSLCYTVGSCWLSVRTTWLLKATFNIYYIIVYWLHLIIKISCVKEGSLPSFPRGLFHIFLFKFVTSLSADNLASSYFTKKRKK